MWRPRINLRAAASIMLMTISNMLVRPKSSGKTLLQVSGVIRGHDGAVVKELCYTIKGDFPQIRREGDDANVISWWEGFGVFRRGHGT